MSFEIVKSLTIDLEVEVKCEDCGTSLSLISEKVDAWGDIEVSVRPCECRDDVDV